MTLRKIETFANQNLTLKAIVYRDNEWNEYRVKFYRNNIHQPNADYHTNDQSDAQHTARKFCELWDGFWKE